LLEVARSKLVAAAKQAGIALKQTFAKEGRDLNRKAACYAHARQWARMRRTIRRQGTIVGRLSREIERKASLLTQAVRDVLGESLHKRPSASQRKAASARRWVVHPSSTLGMPRRWSASARVRRERLMSSASRWASPARSRAT